MNTPQNKNGRNLGVRLDPETSTRLARMEEATGLDAVHITRRLIDAALRFYEARHYLIFPLDVVPQSQPNTAPASPEPHRLNEEPATYASKKRVTLSIPLTPDEATLRQAARTAAKRTADHTKRKR